MKQTRWIMGMPITVDIVDASATLDALDRVFSYFEYVDQKFSTFIDSSEISRINRGLLREDQYSDDMRQVLALCEQTKQESNGYFDIVDPTGKLDPSGLVKGWAIQNAADLLKSHGFRDFYVEASGDIQVHGHNAHGQPWRIGIRNPFNPDELIQSVEVCNRGVATSGTYYQGHHIYDPRHGRTSVRNIVSLTVIGPNVYQADRFATAAFAMSGNGIAFIENLDGFEGYMVDGHGLAVKTSGFDQYTRTGVLA